LLLLFLKGLFGLFVLILHGLSHRFGNHRAESIVSGGSDFLRFGLLGLLCELGLLEFGTVFIVEVWFLALFLEVLGNHNDCVIKVGCLGLKGSLRFVLKLFGVFFEEFTELFDLDGCGQFLKVLDCGGFELFQKLGFAVHRGRH